MTPTPPGPGRPRDPAVDRSIIEAARRELTESGYEGLTMGAVAARAGVGRPTVYRRFADKSALMAAVVVSSLAEANPVEPNAGDVVTDLEEVLGNLTRALTTSDLGTTVTELIGPASRDPDLSEALNLALESRRGLLRSILGRAQAEGCLRTDIEAAIDILLGGIYFRHLMTPAPVDDDYLRSLVLLVVGTTT